MTKCRKQGCDFVASYSKRGTPVRYCSLHKKPHHVRRHTCRYPGCSTIPTFGFSGLYAERCKKHKTRSMVSHPYEKSYNPSKPIDIWEIATPCLMCGSPVLLVEKHCKPCADKMAVDLAIRIESQPLQVENEFLELINTIQHQNGEVHLRKQ